MLLVIFIFHMLYETIQIEGSFRPNWEHTVHCTYNGTISKPTRLDFKILCLFKENKYLLNEYLF